MGNALNDYIEAHVHGTVRLAGDVGALVADPSFAGTPTGDLLGAAADRHGFALEWHAGLVLPLDRVPPDAPDAPWDGLMRWQILCAEGRAHRLAAHVVALGERRPPRRRDHRRGGRRRRRAPDQLAAWGTPAEVLVHLKDLWLLLVALGAPPL